MPAVWSESCSISSKSVPRRSTDVLAYCIVMHTNDVRKHGEKDERMHLLNAWREAPVFSARERAALAWTEAVTKISERHVPDEIYDEARRHFSEKELVDLTAAVVAINAWKSIARSPEAIRHISPQEYQRRRYFCAQQSDKF